jgi:PTS system ascorbate-specific IIA component
MPTTSILLVAHAPLAAALADLARHVYPDCGVAVRAVDIDAAADATQAQALVREAVQAVAGGDVLILADVFGATPCNAALAVADGVRQRVVTGVNVPMLWRTLGYAGLPLDELVSRAVAGATHGVMQVSGPRRQNQPTAPGGHDQVQHHHQQ